MRFLIKFSLGILCFCGIAEAQDLDIVTRPDSVYVERIAGNINPIERVFFHIILHNVSKTPITVHSVRFELRNDEGSALSGEYSGKALMSLFDSSVERRRIEPAAQ